MLVVVCTKFGVYSAEEEQEEQEQQDMSTAGVLSSFQDPVEPKLNAMNLDQHFNFGPLR